jgi:hypothetical protein
MCLKEQGLTAISAFSARMDFFDVVHSRSRPWDPFQHEICGFALGFWRLATCVLDASPQTQ